MKRVMLGFALVLTALTTACGTLVKVEPVTVQPIHITVDVNVHDHRDAADPVKRPSGSP
jgi:hypothetical protein